jgi:hypothetical protein
LQYVCPDKFGAISLLGLTGALPDIGPAWLRSSLTSPRTMQKLRSIHLYLGCIFAPLLLFFAMSGIWQTFGLHSHLLERLSTIHTSHGLKSRDGLSNLGLKIFVLVMAISFIATTTLGIVMAVKFGRSRRAAYYSLAFGVAFPLILILIGRLA